MLPINTLVMDYRKLGEHCQDTVTIWLFSFVPQCVNILFHIVTGTECLYPRGLSCSKALRETHGPADPLSLCSSSLWLYVPCSLGSCSAFNPCLEQLGTLLYNLFLHISSIKLLFNLFMKFNISHGVYFVHNSRYL